VEIKRKRSDINSSKRYTYWGGGESIPARGGEFLVRLSERYRGLGREGIGEELISSKITGTIKLRGLMSSKGGRVRGGWEITLKLSR